MHNFRSLNRLLLLFGIISTGFLGLRCKEEPSEVVAGVASIASMASDSAAASSHRFLAWLLEPKQEPIAYILLVLFFMVVLSTSLSGKTHPHRP